VAFLPEVPHTPKTGTSGAIILAFWDGTAYRTLVHEFGSKQLETIKVLLEIVTQHASREEAVGAAFALVEAVVTASWGQTVPPSITTVGTKKGAKGRKKG
jgi:hypothetical protein